MMNFGDAEGTIAILSPANSKQQKSIHPGETIGEFKLLGVSKDGIDLEWRDQKVHKTLEEMADHGRGRPDGSQTTETAPPVPPRPAALPPAERGPAAVDEGNGIHRCQENDTTPAGAVVGNLRKIVKPGIFGPTCYWEPVGGR